MKRITLLLAVLYLCTPMLQAEEKKLQAFLSSAIFYSPQDGPYVETQLAIDASSLHYVKNDDGTYQGSLNITMIFKDGEEVKSFSKYELKSPAVNDTMKTDFTFFDMQRFLLPNGEYTFEIELSDANAGLEPYKKAEPIIVDIPEDKIWISGIELIEKYEPTTEKNMLSKAGYDIVPYVTSFYPENKGRLIFYGEIYNSDKELGSDGKYLIQYYIESFESNTRMSDYVKIKRAEARTLQPILYEFDIKELPSGNYNLVIELRDKENDLITKNKLFFQRSNPNIQFDVDEIVHLDVNQTFVRNMTSKDTLKEFIRCLNPISSQIEINFAKRQLAEADLVTLQQYFLNFWLGRNPLNPEDEWLTYYSEVQKVNADFKTPVKKGYDTDRGRVYLKYGPPNMISESYNEPSAYPYEIWHYYVLDESQRNKRFVFYTKDIITNDFMLLHSDAIGELHNYRWQIVLHERTYDPTNIDITNPGDHWGGNADKYWRR